MSAEDLEADILRVRDVLAQALDASRGDRRALRVDVAVCALSLLTQQLVHDAEVLGMAENVHAALMLAETVHRARLERESVVAAASLAIVGAGAKLR